MKTYNYLIYCMLFSIGYSTLQARGGLQEYKKTYNEEFSINQNGLVYLANKYGNIDITTSDRSTVKIDIEIIVEARDQDRADDILDKISIKFDNSSSEVKAYTEFDFGNSWNWGKKNESYKIHYKVLMPRDVDLDIYNKYGNISMTEINGDLDLDLKYGSAYLQDIGGDVEAVLGYVEGFDAGAIGGDLDLDIKYSDFNIKGASDTHIETKYSEIVMDYAGEVDISSKYSQIEIGALTAIENVGKYDQFDLGSCEYIDIETKYTQLRIETLAKGGDFDTGYGSVRIKQLHDSFEKINIDAGNTGYDIGIMGGARFDIETKYAGVDLPRNVVSSYKEKDHNEYFFKGHFEDSGAGLITATMKYGHLDVQHRPN